MLEIDGREIGNENGCNRVIPVKLKTVKLFSNYCAILKYSRRDEIVTAHRA